MEKFSEMYQKREVEAEAILTETVILLGPSQAQLGAPTDLKRVLAFYLLINQGPSKVLRKSGSLPGEFQLINWMFNTRQDDVVWLRASGTDSISVLQAYT